MQPHTEPTGAMTINDFRQWARISRTKIYEEIGRGALPAIKVGSRTLITAASARAWLSDRPSFVPATQR